MNGRFQPDLLPDGLTIEQVLFTIFSAMRGPISNIIRNGESNKDQAIEIAKMTVMAAGFAQLMIDTHGWPSIPADHVDFISSQYDEYEAWFTGAESL